MRGSTVDTVGRPYMNRIGNIRVRTCIRIGMYRIHGLDRYTKVDWVCINPVGVTSHSLIELFHCGRTLFVRTHFPSHI